MHAIKLAALLTAVAAASGGAGAAVTEAAHGRAVTIAPEQDRAAVEVLAGGGSRLGVSVREVEEEDVKTAKLPAPAGAVIEDVRADSPAESAGLKAGDVLIEYDGERVRGVRHLTRLVRETPDGRKVQATVVRDGQKTTVTVVPRESRGFSFEGSPDLENLGRRLQDLEKLGRTVRPQIPIRPAPAPRGRTSPPSAWAFEDLLGSGSSRLGISIDTLSPQLAEYFGTKEGVLVTAVTDDSVAAKAGLKAGDVITAFNGSAVDDTADLRRRVQEVKENGEFTIAVMRDRKPLTLKGKLESVQRPRRFRSIV